MKVIGITGGIGSGKSTICKVLEAMGYPVFYTDLAAKQSMEKDYELINKIIQSFGETAYYGNKLNRTFLANRIFSNPDDKAKLNALVHPTVFDLFEKWKKKQQSPFVFIESALMYETGSYKRFDEVVLVVADKATKIKRLKTRDNSSENEILVRMESQMSDEDKLKFQPFVISNDEESFVLKQVLDLIEKMS